MGCVRHWRGSTSVWSAQAGSAHRQCLCLLTRAVVRAFLPFFMLAVRMRTAKAAHARCANQAMRALGALAIRAWGGWEG